MLKIACIPAYNEEGSIADVIKRASNYVDRIIVYDDGSTDQTSKEAKKAGAFVIRSDKNKGKGDITRHLIHFIRFASSKFNLGDDPHRTQHTAKIDKLKTLTTATTWGRYSVSPATSTAFLSL